MNIGAKSSKEDVLVFADADNFLKESLRDSVDLCSGNYPFIKPYRHCVDLNQKQSEFITDQKEFVEGFDKIDAGEQRENSGEVFSPCSGTFVIRSALFDQIGGWDERFVGWGGEDDALSFKLQRRRTPTLELADNVAFHLWHPRAVRDASEYQGNQTLWSRYQSYSDAQLDWLGELQRQGNANLNRYR